MSFFVFVKLFDDDDNNDDNDVMKMKIMMTTMMITIIMITMMIKQPSGIADIIILGDFNINILNEQPARKITELCQQYNVWFKLYIWCWGTIFIAGYKISLPNILHI